MDSMGLTRYMSVLMDDAMKQARFFDHEFVMPEHMLLALLRQYAFCQALQEEGVDSLKMHEDLVGCSPSRSVCLKPSSICQSRHRSSKLCLERRAPWLLLPTDSW